MAKMEKKMFLMFYPIYEKFSGYNLAGQNYAGQYSYLIYDLE